MCLNWSILTRLETENEAHGENIPFTGSSTNLIISDVPRFLHSCEVRNALSR